MPSAMMRALRNPFQLVADHLRSRDVAQPGSALAWGARGRRFKSSRPDQLKQNLIKILIYQKGRVAFSGAHTGTL